VRTILYIVNPISGTGTRKSVEENITLLTKEAGIPYWVYPSVADGNYSYLFPLIKEQKITDIVIAGGDGTINQVVNCFRKLDVQFGIIPCGSGNGLAFSAGISKSIEKALQVVFKGKSKWTDAFTINNQFACMLCGLGLDAQVAHDFANAPKRGLTTYVQKTISTFFSAKSHPFIVSSEGKKFRTKAYFISIANSNQFGNHFTIAPKASLTDGMLDVVIMTKQNKLNVLVQAVKQISGYNKVTSINVVNESASVIYFQGKKVTIQNPSLAPLHIDGDPVETMERMEFEIIPKAFRLIYP
jgi:diacylglycerol kinase (ATP)